MTRFSTVLVANRGEVAVRILRAVSAAGLRSVAVYSDADREAPHVRGADAAIRIGPAAAADSYLSIPALLSAARRTGADAIHPGYGFLSERAEFASVVQAAGLTFIGPPAEVIQAMGRKDRARAIAIAAGVAVVPAADLGALSIDISSGGDAARQAEFAPSALKDIADQIGFPLLVKAAAGGGGKGMRIVRTSAELPDAVAAARRESHAAFGDDTLLFERYVDYGRHIEVQIIADECGKVLHLHERDCSVQRRHQKVLEEAPTVAISAALRKVVLESAVALAEAVSYVNAGTVEFLVSGDDAYFLEMNTRLQVEHPITEVVTGLDLVGLQLQVAQGEPLGLEQSDITVHGHAIEARVYAEDPRHGFLPQAGVAHLVRWPTHARVDAALESGQHVGTHYDPMLGKVIVGGETREAARRALVAALADTAILGLTTNVGFLHDLADSDAFRDCEMDTAWLDRRADEAPVDLSADVRWCLAAWAVARLQRGKASGPFEVSDGWRLAGPSSPLRVPLRDLGIGRAAGHVSERSGAGAGQDVFVDTEAGVVRRGDTSFVVSELAAPGDASPEASLRLEIDGVAHAGMVLVEPERSVWVSYRGHSSRFATAAGESVAGAASVGDGSVLAPMPGMVLAVNVSKGDAVAEGEILGILEAMKMELALKSPHAGVVTAVHATPGFQVELGARLFRVESEGAS